MNKSIPLITALLFSIGAFAQTELKDSQIAKIAVTINEGEIDAAQMAKNKLSNKDVQYFAKMMIDEHKQNMKDTKALVKKEKIGTDKSDMSESLQTEVKDWNKDLKKVDKSVVDKAYVDQQVALHQKVLETFDTVLIPQADNMALKAHLEKTREAVSGHLAHAKKLQTQLQ
jgi:putative membrane protein